MSKLHKISTMAMLTVLSGCVGTKMQKNLEQFFAERDRPSLSYKPGGSYFKGAQNFYDKKNCDELYAIYQKLYEDGGGIEEETSRRIILDIAEQRNCHKKILEWRTQRIKKFEIENQAMMDKFYKDELRREEFRRERAEAQEAAKQEKRARVLREIRNEK